MTAGRDHGVRAKTARSGITSSIAMRTVRAETEKRFYAAFADRSDSLAQPSKFRYPRQDYRTRPRPLPKVTRLVCPSSTPSPFPILTHRYTFGHDSSSEFEPEGEEEPD